MDSASALKATVTPYDDEAAFYCREFMKVSPDMGYVQHQEIGLALRSQLICVPKHAEWELLNHADESPEAKMCCGEFVQICLPRRPDTGVAGMHYSLIKKIANAYIPSNRVERMLRLSQSDFPFNLVGPLLVIIPAIIQIYTCAEANYFFGYRPNWTIMGYLRLRTNLGFVAEAYDLPACFFTSFLIEDLYPRLFLNLWVVLAFMIPHSLLVTPWRWPVFLASVSYGCCQISVILNIPSYNGSLATIDATVWSQFAMVITNRDYFSRVPLRLLIAPCITIINLIITLTTARTDPQMPMYMYLFHHVCGIYIGLTLGRHILKAHESSGFWTSIFYGGFYCINGSLWCIGYFLWNIDCLYGQLPIHVTRVDWQYPEVAVEQYLNLKNP